MSERKTIVETESPYPTSKNTYVRALTFILSWEEDGEELLKFLEAELERTREKKEKAIGAEAYDFFSRKERMLEKWVSKLHIWRQLVETLAIKSLKG